MLINAAVGILAARLAQIRGAQQVILIDREDYRLKFALQKVTKLDLSQLPNVIASTILAEIACTGFSRCILDLDSIANV